MLPKEYIEFDTLDLKEFIKGGITYNNLYHLLYFVRVFRYLSPVDLKAIGKVYPTLHFEKSATYPIMKRLEEIGYLRECSKKVFTANQAKCHPIIHKRGFLWKYIPNEPDGTGQVNARNNIKHFIQCLSLPNFYWLLFPNFTYIEPDGLLIRKYQNTDYEFTFLEIQKDTSNWKLEDKREKYKKLAKDIKVYEYCKEAAQVLELRTPTVQEFKFNVYFICSSQHEWEEGFNFVQSL